MYTVHCTLYTVHSTVGTTEDSGMHDFSKTLRKIQILEILLDKNKSIFFPTTKRNYV